MVLIAASLLGGCSLHSDPTIEVTGVALNERSDEALAFDVTLQMSNRNNVALELLDFDYVFAVDGKRVFHGRRSAEATLGATSDHMVTIPVVVRYDQVDWQQMPPESFEYSLRGHVRYITPGQLAELLDDLGVRRPRAGFANRGRVIVNDGDTDG